MIREFGYKGIIDGLGKAWLTAAGLELFGREKKGLTFDRVYVEAWVEEALSYNIAGFIVKLPMWLRLRVKRNQWHGQRKTIAPPKSVRRG
jgi:hypothetical protein